MTAAAQTGEKRKRISWLYGLRDANLAYLCFKDGFKEEAEEYRVRAIIALGGKP